MRDKRKMIPVGVVGSGGGVATPAFETKMTALNPVLWWKMNEAATPVIDYGSAGKDGIVLNTTFEQDGPYTGSKSYLFNGTTSDITAASFAFPTGAGNEGTLLFWWKISVAVWAEATLRQMIFSADANNYVVMSKDGTTNLFGERMAAAGNKFPVIAAAAWNATTDWFIYAMTWSDANDRLILYQVLKGGGTTVKSTTLTGLNTFVGATGAIDFSLNNNYMIGNISNVCLIPSELSQAQLEDLATV